MSIKFVVNGYFRSGTTFIWKSLKDTLPEYLGLYEPLHPKLAKYIQNARMHHTKDPLHNEFLWDDYLAIDKKKMNVILLKHPNMTFHGIQSKKKLQDYLDEINTLKQDVFLQPNRMHFFLELPKQRYNAKIVHVIRDPIDVFQSMRSAYYKNTPLWLFPIKQITEIYNLQKKNAFQIHQDFHWILNHKKYPHKLSILKKTKMEYDLFGKFVFVWVLSNYFAIKSLEKNKGYLLIYEKFTQNPKKEFLKLCRFLEIECKTYPKVKSKEKVQDKKLKKRFLKKIREYNLQKEYDYITLRLEKDTIK